LAGGEHERVHELKAAAMAGGAVGMAHRGEEDIA
jgi:hypothetical protein